MVKKTVLALALVIAGAGVLSAQSNAFAVTLGGLAFGGHYERSLNESFSIGLEGEYDWVLVLWGDETADIFARWYPTQKAVFLELGLGYGSAFGPETYKVEGETQDSAWFSTVKGFLVKVKAGWRFDFGEPGGFVFEPSIHHVLVLGNKQWLTGLDGKKAADDEFGYKSVINATLSFGWLF